MLMTHLPAHPAPRHLGSERFVAALAVSTGAGVVRYLVDPLLPKTLDMAAGAIFYVAVLGVANCWLFRWSGSIVPGYVASVVFFTAYRLLGDP